MQLAKVMINHVLGIEHLEFKAGKITRITADNGLGKTSILAAIQGALGGGNLSKLIRNGHDKAEVVLTFDDGHKVTAKITEKKTDRKVDAPQGWSAGGAKGWLEQRLNPMSFSPIRFVSADPKERIAQLLDASKLELDYSLLRDAAWPLIMDDFPKAGPIGEPLHAVEMVRKRCYDYRTEMNRLVKDKRSHVTELEATILPHAGQACDPKDLRQQLDAIKQQKADREKEIVRVAGEARSKADAEAAAAERQARAELEAKLKEIRAGREAAVSLIAALARKDEQALGAEYQPLIDEMNTAIGEAEAMATAEQRAKDTRAAITKATNAANEHEGEANYMTEALAKLDEMKIEMMKMLPVAGLSIDDGELLYEGVRFETLNEAKKVEVAMKVAQAAAGEIKLICLDGMERLGAKMRDAFEAWAATSDCQFFLTRVVDGAGLTIDSGEATAA